MNEPSRSYLKLFSQVDVLDLFRMYTRRYRMRGKHKTKSTNQVVGLQNNPTLPTGWSYVDIFHPYGNMREPAKSESAIHMSSVTNMLWIVATNYWHMTLRK